ncbi:MAG: OsmC family protein [Planctomycetaceae bacterium]
MTPEALRQLQAPFKQKYGDDPTSALLTLRATGNLEIDRVACRLRDAPQPFVSGLHPAAGGDGTFVCAAEMMLESLVGCAGVTLSAVATAMSLPVQGGTITAEGDIDFRGTLGVDRSTPIGFIAIRLLFDLDTTATPAQIEKLISLTERYCVVAQTLKTPPTFTARPV